VQQILQQNLAAGECISSVGTLLNLLDWLSDRLPAQKRRRRSRASCRKSCGYGIFIL
jgi:hypothetical protein